MATRRTLLVLLLCLALLAAETPRAGAQPDLVAVLDGEILDLGAPIVVQQGRTLVPARRFLHALGATVDWQQSDPLTASLAGRQIRITRRIPAVLVQDRRVDLDAPPQQIGGVTYLPLRALSEALGIEVDLDAAAGAIYLSRSLPAAEVLLHVIDGPLNVRTGPSMLAAVLTTVPTGTVLGLVQDGPEWAHVEVPGIGNGWVARRYTARLDEDWTLGVVPAHLRQGVAGLQVAGRCLGLYPVVDGHLLAPLREVVELLGGAVGWADGALQVTGPRTAVHLVPGSRMAVTADGPQTLPTAPLIVAGRALAPVRALADWLAADLVYDAARRTINLHHPGRQGGAAGGDPDDRGTCPASPPEFSYIVMDAATGLVLAEGDADRRRPPASTTKLMTALYALELDRLDETVTVSRRAAATDGISLNLQPGERLAVRDLLHAVMIDSANDAAAALAEHMFGSEAAFAAAMTRRARDLGATSTTFYNASGLHDSGHETTARDLALLARHGLQSHDLRALATAAVYEMPGPQRPRKFWNRNLFLQTYPGATGVKNGWTPEAGHTLVAAARRGETELIVVVLGAATRDQLYREAGRLMDEGFTAARRYWATMTAAAD